MKTEVISHLERKMVGSQGIEPLAVTSPLFTATDLQSAVGEGALVDFIGGLPRNRTSRGNHPFFCRNGFTIRQGEGSPEAAEFLNVRKKPLRHDKSRRIAARMSASIIEARMSSHLGHGACITPSSVWCNTQNENL